MTDLDKFRELMTGFGLALVQFPSGSPRGPQIGGLIELTLEPANYDLGYDYLPVFAFNADGSFHSVGSTV